MDRIDNDELTKKVKDLLAYRKKNTRKIFNEMEGVMDIYARRGIHHGRYMLEEEKFTLLIFSLETFSTFIFNSSSFLVFFINSYLLLLIYDISTTLAGFINYFLLYWPIPCCFFPASKIELVQIWISYRFFHVLCTLFSVIFNVCLGHFSFRALIVPLVKYDFQFFIASRFPSCQQSASHQLFFYTFINDFSYLLKLFHLFCRIVFVLIHF